MRLLLRLRRLEKEITFMRGRLEHYEQELKEIREGLRFRMEPRPPREF
jgi:hypothetical protein